MGNPVPNFDAMLTPDEVMAWANQYNHATPTKAQQVFPARPKGYVRTVKNLAHYAFNKATAMRCRLVGEIGKALEYEGICDRIYSRLPDYAKW